MNLKQTITTLEQVGQVFGNENSIKLQEVLDRAYAKNKWFTAENVKMALSYWANQLNTEKLSEWAEKEQLEDAKQPKTIGIVAAGNIPLVGLHDVLSVLLTGNKVKIKLSSDDEVLMQFFIDTLISLNSAFSDRIETVERLENMDAVIATGSNNTARYFEYYFGKHPNIIRKNRNSIAVVTGDEDTETLTKIGWDMVSYFGKGCRNITQIWAPEGYNWETFIDAQNTYADIVNHNKYANNYHYHKAILLMNQDTHLDSGFMLYKEDRKVYSPIGMVNYTHYKDMGEVKEFLAQNADNIQCVVSNSKGLPEAIPAGETQNPTLWDYADDVNTIAFLKNL